MYHKKSFRQALTLKPDHVKALNNLGNTLKEQGKLEEAEKIFRKALALNPHYTNNLLTKPNWIKLNAGLR